MTASRRYGSGRARILEAARVTFSERGYHGATSRDIAKAANLTEAMVYRHFGSKAVLFQEAAVAPLTSFMETYVAAWQEREHGVRDATEEARAFFAGLVDVLATNRSLLLAVHAAGSFDDEVGQAEHHLSEAFGLVISGFTDLMDAEFGLRGFRSDDRPALARVIVAMLTSLALHADWLRVGDGDDDVSLARVLDEAAAVIAGGVRPPAATPD